MEADSYGSLLQVQIFSSAVEGGLYLETVTE